MSVQDVGRVVLCSAAVLAVAGACVAYFISQRRLRSRLYGDRPTTTAEEYYLKYFAESGLDKEVVVKIVEILNRETRLDFTRIHPDQQFGSPFGDWLGGDDWMDIGWSIEEEFSIKLPDDQFDLTTPRQFIQQVAPLI